MALNLSKVLKVGYKNKDKQRETLNHYGYIRDNELSNDNQQVFYDPVKKKLLYNVTGTHNISDVGTDAYLALGMLKNTNRYKEADQGLKMAKKKYNVQSATVTGHSLGSTISQGIASNNDQEYSLNPGYTVFQPTKGGNQHNYRTNGDVVSLLGSRAKNIKTIGKDNNKSIVGSFVTGGLLGVGKNLLSSHKPDTISGEHIYV